MNSKDLLEDAGIQEKISSWILRDSPQWKRQLCFSSPLLWCFTMYFLVYVAHRQHTEPVHLHFLGSM